MYRELERTVLCTLRGKGREGTGLVKRVHVVRMDTWCFGIDYSGGVLHIGPKGRVMRPCIVRAMRKSSL